MDQVGRKRRGPGPVRRITLRWRDGEWHRMREIHVPSMTLPTSTVLPADSPEGVAGFWYEVRDATGALLYRRAVESPFEGYEIVGRDGSLRRGEPVPEPEVDLLVPDLQPGLEIHLWSDHRAPGEKPARGARLVAKLPLRRVKAGKGD